jgi:hypothetical protein
LTHIFFSICCNFFTAIAMHASILDFLLLVKKGQVVVFTPKLTKFVQTDRQRERKRCFDFGLLTDDQSSPDWNLCLSWGLGIVVNFKLTNLLLLAYCRYCYMYIWRKFRVSNIHNPSLSILDIKNPWKKSMGQALEMNWGLGEPPKHIPQVHGWVTN